VSFVSVKDECDVLWAARDSVVLSTRLSLDWFKLLRGLRNMYDTPWDVEKSRFVLGNECCCDCLETTTNVETIDRFFVMFPNTTLDENTATPTTINMHEILMQFQETQCFIAIRV
jgi:hypothetical protein